MYQFDFFNKTFLDKKLKVNYCFNKVLNRDCEKTRNYLYLVNCEILPRESTDPRRAVKNGK